MGFNSTFKGVNKLCDLCILLELYTRVTGTLREDPCIFMAVFTEFFQEGEIFQTKFVGKIKTHILYSVTFPRKSCRL